MKYIYFQQFLIFLTSLTNHCINGFVDIYSYTKFESPVYLFLNGVVIYLTELGIIYIYTHGRRIQQKLLYNIYGISVLGVSFTFCIIGKRIPFILTVALGIIKFMTTIFNNYRLHTLSNQSIEKVKQLGYLTYLTIFSGMLSPFIMYMENNFLELSLLYYICFILNIKLIH
jgi:hypothetical protein